MPGRNDPLCGYEPVPCLITAISDCLPVIGTPDFTEPFMSVVQLTGASQVTVFAYHPDKVECLVSRNFQSDDEGGILAAAYLDGGFRDDPLYRRAIAMDPGECIVERLEDILPRINSRYLAMFFGSAGFRTKIATMVAQDSLRMVANLYFREPTSEPFGGMQELSRLIGRTLATHFLRLNPPDFPFPLAVLSERERQVCLGMLAGKKAEIIAEEVGVGPSSVVTYRQRAYQKLGISSRGELFAICHSWHSQHAQPQMVRARLPN